MPELAVYRTSFSMYCRRDVFPGSDVVFLPDSWSILGADGVPRDDGCFADNKGAWYTCSLLIILCDIWSISAPRSDGVQGTFVHGCRPVVVAHAIPGQRCHCDTMAQLYISNCQWLKEFRHLGSRCWYNRRRGRI